MFEPDDQVRRLLSWGLLLAIDQVLTLTPPSLPCRVHCSALPAFSLFVVRVCLCVCRPQGSLIENKEAGLPQDFGHSLDFPKR